MKSKNKFRIFDWENAIPIQLWIGINLTDNETVGK